MHHHSGGGPMDATTTAGSASSPTTAASVAPGVHAESIVGFKHRLANYFERISGDVSHLKGILDTLPKAYATPESQDTLMRFISDRFGVEEAEAAEELDYVTARLERERRNERFERLLEPWTSEQMESSLRQFFSSHDPAQLPTVSALVTFYRGREIVLIRELELQYRKPLLLYRDDEEIKEEEAGAMELAQAASLMPKGGDADNNNSEHLMNQDDDDDDDDGDLNRLDSAGNPRLSSSQSLGQRGGSTPLNGGGGKIGGDGNTTLLSGNRSPANTILANSGQSSSQSLTTKNKTNTGIDSSSNNNNKKSGSGSSKKGGFGEGEALRIRTNWNEITVDSTQQFEMEILRFLLDIRQELQDRIKESELLAQQYAAVGSVEDLNASIGSGGNNTTNLDGTMVSNASMASASSGGQQISSASITSPSKRKSLRKTSTIRRAIAAAHQANSEDAKMETDRRASLSASSSPAALLEGDNIKNNNNKPDADTIAASVNELTKELAALPRKRLARVEKLLQIIPLVARAVTPVFKSQLFIYLGFFCSLRIEARKVMQKRISGQAHDAPLKADENLQRRMSTLIVQEQEARNDLEIFEKRTWNKMDPLFYREMFLRLIESLVDEEAGEREEIEFDELCISSVARAKLRSLFFIERSYADLNSFS